MLTLDTIAVICDRGAVAVDLTRATLGVYRLKGFAPSDVASIAGAECSVVIIDCDSLSSHETIREAIAATTPFAIPTMLIYPAQDRKSFAAAGFLRGRSAVSRPIAGAGFLETLERILRPFGAGGTPPAAAKTAEARASIIIPEGVRIDDAASTLAPIGLAAPRRPEALAKAPQDLATAVNAATDAIFAIFANAQNDMPLSRLDLERHSLAIADSIKEFSISSWVDMVRQYHDQTYQHCLLVTGVTASFGAHVGFSQRDVNRITLAALLHDVGKVSVPQAILNKPSELTPEEFAVIKSHPRRGYEILRHSEGFDEEMLDLVLSHHEYLDGSGYPNGKSGGEISDLCRVVTIADIFSALIEKRPYKKPLSNLDAYEILLSMRDRVDIPLVRAQREMLLAA
jgi:putative nucleotidyltransferase with HDIG domain